MIPEGMSTTMFVAALALAFIMGASIFSFYMASASRVLYFFYGPARKQLSYPMRWKEFFSRRSFCDDCESQIPPGALAPVLGYFLARRHCQSCGSEIPAIHPIMESLGGFLMVYFLLASQDFLLSILALLFCGHLIISITTDWTLYALDYENTILAALIALLFLGRKSMILHTDPLQEASLFWQNLALFGESSIDSWGLLLQFLTFSVWIGPALTAIGALLLFLPIHFWKPEGLGLGDVWLMVPLALFHSMPFVLIPIIAASGWSIMHILVFNRDVRSPAPLGAFLAIGSMITAVVQFAFY
ncbi:MAG: prepilin peptidase [Leptospiraceae bacterium]|nr:prepilin peptidase [Leptospiraceae bacterium]